MPPEVKLVHFSLVQPATAASTPCGQVGLATSAWRYVTCPECLAHQPSKRCSR